MGKTLSCISFLCILSLSLGLISCSKDEVSQKDSSSRFPGRWESEYQIDGVYVSFTWQRLSLYFC